MITEYVHELGEVKIPYQATLPVKVSDVQGRVKLSGSCGCISVVNYIDVDKDTFFKYEITKKNDGDNQKNIYLWALIDGRDIHVITHVLKFR